MSKLAEDARYLGNKYLIEGLLEKIPLIGRNIREYKRLRRLVGACGYEPGHFYSPIPSLVEVNDRSDWIFSDRDPLSVDLNVDSQLSLLEALKEYHPQLPYDFMNKRENPDLRYRWTSGCQYRYSDVVFLYSVMRYLQPKRIIEVGSGASSAVMLDVSQLFFGSSIQMTFIEPFPERLFGVLSDEDKRVTKILERKVQDVPLDLFLALEENDILFIDSSHVVKVGSDVNYIVFEVLPRLKKGVWIHFHDIFFPFELPRNWIIKYRRFWAESYLLRAFLMNNNAYEIALFNTLLQKRFRGWFETEMPECLIGEDSTRSIWIRKL